MPTRAAFDGVRAALLVALLLPLSAFADGGPAAVDAGMCGRAVAADQCRWMTGTVTIFNGTPAVRIRPAGGGKLLAVGPAEDEWMPEELRAALTPDNAVHARLFICPLPRNEPRGLTRVCVRAVKQLRVLRR